MIFPYLTSMVILSISQTCGFSPKLLITWSTSSVHKKLYFLTVIRNGDAIIDMDSPERFLKLSFINGNTGFRL